MAAARHTNRSRALQVLLMLAVLAGALTGLGRPAGALENSDFGIDRSGGRDIEVRAGKTTHGEVRLWNKTDAPITVRLWPGAARIDDAGTAQLGGDETAVGWVSLSESQVTIPAHGEQMVAIDVKGPRQVPPGKRTVAILAETVPGEGVSQAVVERLAVISYLTPAGPASAGLGWLLWAGIAVLLVAVAGIIRTSFRRRPPFAVAPA